MSHTDVGPLPAYNSLTDNHLSGYFSNTRMRRHLRKSGLITKKGEIVTENTYRLNMARKEHKKHVKNMLAQAIVHKTLDLERSRQSEIRKKLEEISKIELVRHVRASKETKRESCILPLVSPKGGGGSRPSSSSTYSDMRSKGRYRPARPKSTPSRKGKRPISALSSNFDDENETVVYLDDEGRPISPSHIDENELRYASKDPIDTRHLYSLDTAALRKYAVLMAQLEQGKDRLASPYLVPQVPIPPKSPHHGGTPRSAHRQRVSAERLDSPKRPAVSDQAYLHPSSSPKSFRGQQQSMCEIFMIYHGQALSLAREQLDKRQDVAIEQQHCGGNTLTVFKDKMEPNTEFSFISYRHCGYPFALTVYIDGKMDCRISTCCEYRHSKGRRIAGKKGHFSVKTITGAKPCYKCQVEKGIRIKSQAPRPKLKRPPQHQEEVVVVETKEEQPEEKQDDEPVSRHRDEEEILVPVEDDDRKGGEADGDDYDDDDFEESEPEEERFSKNPTSYDDDDDVDGRKTSLGQSVVIEEGAEEDEEEAREPSPRPASPVPAPTDTKDEGRQRSDSVSSKASTSSSSSSSSSVSSRGGGSSDDYSDSKVDDEAPKKEETKVVSIEQEQRDSGNEVEIPVGSGEVNEALGETRPVETEVEVEEKKEVEKEEITPEESTKVAAVLSQPSSSSISSSSSSSGSATIHDRGPNTVNDPTSIEDKEDEQEQEREEMEKLENQKAEDLRAKAPPLISIQDAVEPQQEDFKGISSNEPQPSVENGRSSNDPPVFVQEVVESPNEIMKESRESKKDSDSSSSGSGSDSSSDSDSDNTSKEPNKENSGRKEATIETKADVHLDNDGRKFNYGTFEEAESDPEQTHGGSDPDNVANDNGTTVKKTIDPVPLGHPREGSIIPLLEANQNAIEIKGVTLNKTQVYEVAEFLEKSKKLNTVTLVNCGIDDDDVQKIMEGLRDSPSNPVMLNLSLNPLTVTSVYHILKTVEIKTSVEAVLLQGTRLGDDGVNALVDGIMSLYEIVKENPEEKEKGIHELDLSDSKFGDEGAVAIARLLKSEVDMDTVTLSHNHAISLDGWRTIGESLRETQHLETLTLDHNFIGDEGMEVIAAGLHTNSSLTALDINNVGITDTGAKCLMNMLKENTVLLEIVMMDNKISDSIGENIQKYISLNKAASSN